MIEVWIADISPLKEKERYDFYFEKLPMKRKKKAERLRYPTDKCQSVGAWAVWEKMQQEYSFGTQTVFNFSHSGNYVMCAARDSAHQDMKIGCDIEQVKDFKEGVVKRFFAEEENAFIGAIKNEDAKCESFYQHWVLKESFMKAVRLGMKLEMSSFAFRIEKYKNPVLTRQPDFITDTFEFREFEIEKGKYKAAVCFSESEEAKGEICLRICNL